MQRKPLDPSFPPTFAGAVAGATDFIASGLNIFIPAKAGIQRLSLMYQLRTHDSHSPAIHTPDKSHSHDPSHAIRPVPPNSRCAYQYVSKSPVARHPDREPAAKSLPCLATSTAFAVTASLPSQVAVLTRVRADFHHDSPDNLSNLSRTYRRR